MLRTGREARRDCKVSIKIQCSYLFPGIGDPSPSFSSISVGVIETRCKPFHSSSSVFAISVPIHKLFVASTTTTTQVNRAIMDTAFIPPDLPYCTSPTALTHNIPDLTYAYDTCSTNSSPSPSFVYGNVQSSLDFNAAVYPPPMLSSTSDTFAMSMMDHSPPIEFMDLTDSSSTVGMHNDAEGRRRRRLSSTFHDKEAASNMRIRRRAQNRASQRAFRERKEKHVQQLEAQLAELEGKHKTLAKKYSDLLPTQRKLKEEAEKMKEEIRVLRRASSNTPCPFSGTDDLTVSAQSDWGASLFDDGVDAEEF